MCVTRSVTLLELAKASAGFSSRLILHADVLHFDALLNLESLPVKVLDTASSVSH